MCIGASIAITTEILASADSLIIILISISRWLGNRECIDKNYYGGNTANPPYSIKQNSYAELCILCTSSCMSFLLTFEWIPDRPWKTKQKKQSLDGLKQIWRGNGKGLTEKSSSLQVGPSSKSAGENKSILWLHGFFTLLLMNIVSVQRQFLWTLLKIKYLAMKISTVLPVLWNLSFKAPILALARKRP